MTGVRKVKGGTGDEAGPDRGGRGPRAEVFETTHVANAVRTLGALTAGTRAIRALAGVYRFSTRGRERLAASHLSPSCGISS